MIKRIFDLLLVFLCIIFLMPIFLIICLLVKLDSKGSIFFLQNRVGLDEKIFKIIKFRTMYINQSSISTITLKNDPRITKIGKYLRNYKLDELPELFNVLIGDMSFVGPRPDVAGYADKLVGVNRNILKLKPGITSWASLKYVNEELLLTQVKDPISYNNRVIYPDKVKMNLNYYNNHNIWIDIKVIFATISLLLSGLFKHK
ncbi:MAG: sugar transferase [Flavobacteriales bacterium]|jgi:lipopolysaccharide/colanic/teichoic acid biosynthesis glycosyltransferase|nr:sugar transferase [Flavobacteriales bacterium]